MVRFGVRSWRFVLFLKFFCDTWNHWESNAAGSIVLGTPESGGGGKDKREVRAIFEVMANLVGATDGTPSMIDEVDDDMTPLVHVSKQMKKKGIDEDGIPIGSPNRIDDVAKSTTEKPHGSTWKCSAAIIQTNPDESSTGILTLLMSLSQDVNNVMGNVDCLRDEIKGNKKDFENLKEESSSKMDWRLQERTTGKTANPVWNSSEIQEQRKSETVGSKELAVMKDELKNLKMVLVMGLGSGTFGSATATHFSVEWNAHSKKDDGIQRLGHRLFKR